MFSKTVSFVCLCQVKDGKGLHLEPGYIWYELGDSCILKDAKRTGETVEG